MRGELMKRCNLCGKSNEDDAMVCVSCNVPFDESMFIKRIESKGSKFPLIIGLILVLVGAVFLVVDVVNLKINSLSILYVASGATLLSTRDYHSKNDQMIEILQTEISKLKDQLKDIHKKNAD